MKPLILYLLADRILLHCPDYEIWTATSLVDPCRDQNNPTSPILMGNSRTKAKPSVMTFCPWYLAAAKTAVLPDLFIVSEQLGSRLMSEPEFSLPAGTTVVDLYVMIKHIILLGVCTVFGTPNVFR